MGYAGYKGFWKTSPREIMALADIKLGKARHQVERSLMEDYVEGED